MDTKSIDKIIPLIYAAALDEEIWHQVTTDLSVLFGDAGITIDSNLKQFGKDTCIATSHFEKDLQNLHYEAYTSPAENPGISALLNAPVGRPFELDSFITTKTFDSDPSIRQILQPQNIDKGLFTTLERHDQNFSFINIFRRKGQADFEREDIQLLAVLGQHITKSFKIRRTLQEQEHYLALAHIKAHSNKPLEGTLFLNGDTHIINADAEALAILKTHKGLALQGGRLISTSYHTGQDTQSLQDFLSTPMSQAKPFSIRMEDDTLTLLERFPLPTEFLKKEAAPNIQMLMIRYINLNTQPNMTAFTSAYGLTPAEERVTTALTRCETATKAASSLGIGRDTVKSHLQNIYAKVRVKSLPQLMMQIGKFR